MKKVKIKDLVPGMKVEADVYSYDNRLIIPKGQVLTDQLITKLELYSVYNVYTQEQENAPVPSPAEEDSYSGRIRKSPEFRIFQCNFEEEMLHFKNTMNNVVKMNTELDVSELLDQAMGVMNSVGQTINIFDMLQNMRYYDDSTFAHSLNVALICNVFAGWLNMTAEETETATLCGMLHDIGKLLIPDKIIKKPDRLTDSEFAIVKTHPIRGYELLTKLDIDSRICNTALMHHEKCDGTGYPFGLKGNKINKYAKMISIVDVYDAMTSARIYRGPLCPFTVISIFESEGFQKYDAEFILIFLERVICTYLQNKVRLNNGQEGEIIYINKEKLSRPIIRIKDKFINLMERNDLSIEAII